MNTLQDVQPATFLSVNRRTFMTICFIDTETCGLDPYKNQVLTAAMKIVQPGKPDTTKEISFGLLQSTVINDKALEVNGITREEIKKFPSAQDTYKELINFLQQFVNPYDRTDKMIFAGYNARFDYDMMRAMFERLGDKYFGSWFWFPPLDIMNTAMDALQEDRAKLSDFKLGTVARFLNVEVDKSKLHGALYDIELAIEVYHKSQELIQRRFNSHD